ncbi:malate dehydrogenase (quinone) [Nocardia huaxiensis]|uniref:Probable malate:quinone oxidoreductase n=1 Tax=Nocardia huaxiensis TaxID=2755382 RepID=A0A7D6V892_9NOCA|nr:malate dehydrogenase (quinone) [Nocardia huaxiensis]QLY28733.1 malate dehydrogenase (quinone) [Nocardia huaxiensis]UFS97792.1 malate dehydrogenase (quinone) [Nocardia huaxiensis]
MTGPLTSEPKSAGAQEIADVVLIGGGIMSATLGAILAKLQPNWSVVLYERLGALAQESTNPWNNAGTGHSGLCELNYMPDPHDPGKAEQIAGMFQLSRRFWDALAEDGNIRDQAGFLSPAPHMDVVFGDRDVAYLRERFETLRALPHFSAMRYTEDPATLAEWAPLVMNGRTPGEPMAATRYEAGTDIDFGALTHALVDAMADAGADIRLRREVTGLRRTPAGVWAVTGRDRNTKARFGIEARFVFVGAGGYALKLLQQARIPEVRGYAVFPFGAQFLRTDNPAVVARHEAKVYSQAALGAPPMSVPHLDKRLVDGRESLLFGPYATFSTRLLKNGRRTDLFTTLRPRNLAVLIAVGIQNMSLIGYLIGQLLSTRKRKFAQLQRFYPEADPADWYPVQAGQRAQLVKPDPDRIGVLTFGTELVTSVDGTIAGLLGASPGASTAPAIMLDLLDRCFPDHAAAWEPTLRKLFGD